MSENPLENDPAAESPEQTEGEKRSYMLGLGFDARDGQQRITRSDNFVVLGGSGDTHSRMTDNIVAFNELLVRYGRRLEDLSAQEYYRIIAEIGDAPRNWWFDQLPYPISLGGPRG